MGRTAYNAVSPSSIAFMAYAGFLLAWLFPGPIYSSIVHEPDLVWLDPSSLAYFTSCLVAFLLGVRTISHFRHDQPLAPSPKVAVSNSLVYLLAPLAITALLCFLYIREVGANISFVSLLASSQGDVIKRTQLSGGLNPGKYAYAIPVLIGSVCWAIYRGWQLELKGIDGWVYRLASACTLAVGIIALVSTADRTELLELLSGASVVYLYGRSGGTTWGGRSSQLLLRGAVLALFGLFVFAALAYTRGVNTTTALLESLMGYTIASYNRMAALLHGQMAYVYHGRGIYLGRFLLDQHRLNTIIPIAHYMGWPPTFDEVWYWEYSSVAAAGLNPMFIWSGAFGYLYSELGWGAVAYLYAGGLLVGYTWGRFKAGGSIAIVLYPFMAFWILFWFTEVTLFDDIVVGLTECALLLLVWDKLCLVPARRRPQSRKIAHGGPRTGWIESDRPISDGASPARKVLAVQPFTALRITRTSGWQ